MNTYLVLLAGALVGLANVPAAQAACPGGGGVGQQVANCVQDANAVAADGIDTAVDVVELAGDTATTQLTVVANEVSALAILGQGMAIDAVVAGQEVVLDTGEEANDGVNEGYEAAVWAGDLAVSTANDGHSAAMQEEQQTVDFVTCTFLGSPPPTCVPPLP